MTIPHETQEAAYPIAGPVVLGDLAGIYLLSLLSVVFVNHLRSEGWARAGKGERGVILAVVFLTTLYSAITVHDLWFYGTLLSEDVGPLLTGTITATAEPMIAGLIALFVQTTLALRGSRVIKSPSRRWLYLSLIGALILLSFAGSIIATVWSVHYHFGGSSDEYLEGLTFPASLSLWMWAAAVTDASISASYIIMLRRRLKAGNEIAVSAMKMIITITVRSALYTAVLALVSAIASQTLTANGAFNSNCIPYAFWLPLAQLYALSLFTTLGAADKVSSQLGQRRELERIKGESGSGVSSSGLGSMPVVVSVGTPTYGFEVDFEKGDARSEKKEQMGLAR